MPSSTSSSERAGLVPAAVTVARAGILPLVAGVLFLGGLWVAARALPAPALPLDLEGIVVDGQRARAAALGDVDVLIVGDSSALMGIDAAALGRALGGKRVESLATIGYVGPAGFARLLEAFTAGGRRATTVVLMMHGVSLALPESLFARKGFEAHVAGREAPRARVRRALDDLYQRLVAPVLDLPLPGAFGQRYGRPDDLAAALRDGHGALVDPNRYAARDDAPFTFELSAAVATRLEDLRATAARLGVRDLRLAVAPIPEGRVGAGTLESRAAVVADLARRLGITAPLELPASAPDRDFATLTHLDAEGRAAYTAALARALAR